MKWPSTLTIIRHGESAYNLLKKEKTSMPEFLEFKEIFDRDFKDAKDETWPSERLKKLAHALWLKTKLPFSDYETPLTKDGFTQAKETGEKLASSIPVPDIIYVSPYLRTRSTLEGLLLGWPALNSIKVISEERIREQEHGMQALFNDWALYAVFNPLQGLLFKLEGDYSYRYLNGESKADVRDRVRSFLTTLIREYSGQNVLVVSHHLTLLSIRATLERWMPEQFAEVDKNQKPINCGVTVYRGDPARGKDGRLVLDFYNQKLY